MYPFATRMLAGVSAIALAASAWSTSDITPDWVLSEGNTRVSRPAAGTASSGVRGSSYRSAGKWYAEMTLVALGGVAVFCLANSAYSVGGGTYPGNDAKLAIRYTSSGAVVFNSSSTVTGKAPLNNGGVLGIALDRDAGTIDWYVNGTFQYKSTEIPSGPLALVLANSAEAGTSVRLNIGQSAFASAIPSGFLPWG